MLKILYAVGNSSSAKVSLFRFLQAIDGKPYIIKIAAYKASSPSINIDWTLDSLLNIMHPESFSLENDNYKLYYEWIKAFNPDLIISDLEYFTSYIANILNIRLWQCSSSLLNYALTPKSKYCVGAYKNYAKLFDKSSVKSQYISHILHESNLKFAYSHLGDISNPPELNEGYEWIRPYHKVGKPYIPCQHNIVAGLLNNNKNIINSIKKYSDVVIFSEFIDEKFENIRMKRFNNYEEYYCNIFNSALIVSEGQTSFMADAFYNGKFSVIYPNFNDEECILNALFSEHLGLSKTLFVDQDIEEFVSREIVPQDNNIKYLHQKIEDLI